MVTGQRIIVGNGGAMNQSLDGGATWTRLTIAGVSAGTAIVALEAGNGSVHAVVLDGQGFRVASSPVGTDDFRLSRVRVPVGAGPVPVVQLVLSGPAGGAVASSAVGRSLDRSPGRWRSSAQGGP